MESRWHFKRWQPGDTPRDPIQGEFFATEAIRDSAEALVREAIQNSLDARRNGQAAKVRFFLSGTRKAVAPAVMEGYLKDLWPHVAARKNGLYEPPDPTEACTFVVVEDFGTTGVEGDPAQWHRDDDTPNGFFSFFRAEGVSDKKKTDRGRWGIGKFVFPRSSRIGGFFGLTARASDERRLLIGRTILKSHTVSREYFVPDGYFGLRVQDQGLVMPIEEPTLLDSFAKTFGLKRGNETGLSVVVLYPYPEVNALNILKAAIRGYFFPILKGDLEIVVETPENITPLTKTTLHSAISKLGEEFADEMRFQVALAQWGIDEGQANPFLLKEPSSDGGPKWDEAMVSEQIAAGIWTGLSNGQKVAVRVPLVVRPKKGPNRTSYFDIFMQRGATEDSGRPVFAREGILISDAKGGTVRGTTSLVVVDHEPLAELLGDAENPAHTEWRPDTANFKNKYNHGPVYLTFVKDSVARLMHIISDDQAKVDPNLLIDILSVEVPPDAHLPESQQKQPKRKLGDQTNVNVPHIPRLPQRFRIGRQAGGFAIGPGDPGVAPPESIEIKVAYDVRRGNALTKYAEEDFEFFKKPLLLNPMSYGAEVLSAGRNVLSIRLTNSDFWIGVTGFDENRDLVVSARVVEVANGH